MTQRYEIINHIIQKNGYKKYLEIGVQGGVCFEKINIEYKDSVDPQSNEFVKFAMTSDEFFKQLDKDIKYDIIFIDGLHHDYQVYKDIINALSHLSENGTILCHDMNPPTELHQRKEMVLGDWNGDCWKAFVKLRATRNDLQMFTIDTDWGIGVIKTGKQELITIPNELTFDFLEQNRNSVLNLISVDKFLEL